MPACRNDVTVGLGNPAQARRNASSAAAGLFAGVQPAVAERALRAQVCFGGKAEQQVPRDHAVLVVPQDGLHVLGGVDQTAGGFTANGDCRLRTVAEAFGALAYLVQGEIAGGAPR